MSFPYKNPISPIQLNGTQSVPRNNTYGTTFSVNNTGGYMEVFSLSDLYYTIPTGTTGSIEYSGNTIPIEFTKGTGDAWSPDVITLASDNISSGRRRLGMLVYVYEEDQVYQYRIDNYETLWNAATAATNTVTISNFGTTVRNTTVAGQNFINAWTGNTIEGVGGATHSTAVWKKFSSGSSSGTTTGGTLQNYYGSFSDTTNQAVSAANTATAWSANTTEISNGIYIQNGSKITVSNTAIYEIGYSAQIEKTQGTNTEVTIWAEINGNLVDRSSSTLGLVSNSVYQLPFVSYILELNAGDYVEFYFSSPSQYVQITTLSGLTSPTRPVSPSLIIVAKAIGNAVLNNSGDTFVTGFTLNNDTLTLTQNRVGSYAQFDVSLSSITSNFLYVTGTGINSTVRCGVNNTSAGDFGGALAGSGNTASGKYSFVGGGYCNTASSYNSTIGGGQGNTASNSYSTVGGGKCNIVTGKGVCSSILGGNYNSVELPASSILGGLGNIVKSFAGNINGGVSNIIGSGATFSNVYCTDSAYNRVVLVGDVTTSYPVGNTVQFFNFFDSELIRGSITNSTYSGGYTCLDLSVSTGSNTYNTPIVNLDNINNYGCYHSINGGSYNTISSPGHSTIGGGSCNTTSGGYSFIGGGIGNTANGGVSTIGGGIQNISSGGYSTVGGGRENTSSGYYSAVGGGDGNTSSGCRSFIGGGYFNTSSGGYSTIGGGNCNTASGCRSFIGGGLINTSSGGYSFVGGGGFNISSGSTSSVVGGFCNVAGGACSFIGGGCCNSTSAINSFIGAGISNRVTGSTSSVVGGVCNVAVGNCSFIGGGFCNTGSGNYSIVGSGIRNTSSGTRSTVVGGCCNSASGCESFIGGGFRHTSSGSRSTISGGYRNLAQGSVSFIGGGVCNNVCNSTDTCLATGSVIAGGIGNNTLGGTFVLSSSTFTVAPTLVRTCTYTFIGGGFQNRVTGTTSSVVGGLCNIAGGDYSFIGGGTGNTVSGTYSIISGGRCNTITGSTSTISGGYKNTANSSGSTIGGGLCNTASNTYSTVSGGRSNTANGSRSTVSGGDFNNASGIRSTVSGGFQNTASGGYAIVGGGCGNIASGNTSTIAGGLTNIAGGACSFIGGGCCNTASGVISTISGGYKNIASGNTTSVLNGNTNIAGGGCSTVLNGLSNNSLGCSSFIGGGSLNRTTTNASFSSVVNGQSNCSDACFTSIVGGVSNCITASNCYSSIVGGKSNVICSTSNCSFIGGGTLNIAAGQSSSVVGGSSNTALCSCSFVGAGQFNSSCSIFSFVGGGQCNIITGTTSAIVGGFCNRAQGIYSFVGAGTGNTVTGAYSSAFGCGLNATASCTLYANNIITGGFSATTISASTISTPFTTGSVIFQGSGGTLTQNNSQLFWDDTNNRLGIGTTSPADLLTINANAANARIRYNNSNSVQWTAGNNASDNSFRIGNATNFQFAIFQATGNVLLQNGGTFTDAGYKLDVNGTARVQNHFYQSSGFALISLGNNLNLRSNIAGGSGYIIDAQSYNTLNSNNNEQGFANFLGTYAPTSASGTPSFNALKVTPTINQTGGASGITRGLYVNPTLTSAADFRAIEVERGKVILNSISGNTLIGTTADTGTYKLDVRGLTRFSAATGTSLTVISSGNSTSVPVFSVQGSQGELFSVTDSLTGSLFSVSDISGLPIMEVFSDSTIVLGDYQAPSLYTTKRVTSITASTGTTIYSFPTSAYTSSFVDYFVSGSTGLRAGNMMAIWSGSTVNFTETSTNDIGVTTPVTLGYVMSGSSAVLRASASTGTWIVESILRGL
jgi:hypothetical protein